MFRRLFVRSRRVHFLHIGKCGGSAVKDLAERINKLPTGPLIVTHGHSTKLRHLPQCDPYFFAIRNPVTRFYSAFYMRKRKEQPRLYREWKDGERDAFTHFAEANDLAENLFAKTALGYHAFAAMQSIGHMSYQHTWFNINDLMRVRPPLCVLRQERLDEDVKLLLDKLEITAEMTLPEDSKIAHRNDYSSTPAPSEAAINNLQRWYAVDIEYYRLINDWIERL